MKIGDLDLGDRPLLLAPMEDVTDLSFRYVCKKFGADMMYTEFISSDGLIRDVPGSLYKLRIFDYERPIGMQIYGHIPEAMVESALRVEAARPDVIDINFGCPVNKIARRGAGSGMMREPDKMVEITRRVVDAVKLPVTVKTRLGWDEDSKIIVELAERLQDVGIKAITIHGRTRCQMYKGEADWTLIGEVKRNPRMRIPVIGNGDIKTPQDAANAFERYGVDGVMVGRASFGHPWIFRSVDLPGDEALSGYGGAFASDERDRTSGSGEGAFRQITGVQGRADGSAGDAQASVLLFQGTSGLQGDKAAPGDRERPGQSA